MAFKLATWNDSVIRREFSGLTFNINQQAGFSSLLRSLDDAQAPKHLRALGARQPSGAFMLSRVT